MKYTLHLALTSVLVFLCAPGVRGQASVPLERRESNPGLEISVSVSRSFGQTSFEMDALTPDPQNTNELVPIRSKLEFPLDATLLGLNAEWKPGMTVPWSFGVAVKIGVDYPSELIRDSDFFGDKQIFFGESPPDVDFFMATAEVRYGLRSSDRGKVDLLLHIQYERIDQHGVGFEGWQGSLFSDTRVPISEMEPVIDYQVKYLSPQVGASIERLISDNIGFGLLGSVGVVFAADSDNHLKRGRESKGSGFGVGTGAQGSFKLLPGSLPVKSLSLEVYGALRYYYATGTSDQTFSDGSQYLDLAYTFESLMPQVGVSAAINF
jgi:hypothetical protein